nr:unnamed protein product [Callosobruchus chinensis]
MKFAVLPLLVCLIAGTKAAPSAVELVQDIYRSCLSQLSVGCVKPKALYWMEQVADKNEIRVTEDLVIVKKFNRDVQETRGLQKDILDRFEDFLQSHDVVAKAPSFLRPDGPFGKYVPRTFQASDLSVPLAASGRSSKIVKKVILPFLLGLKFKTAVLVPLALALIALKTWKALTLSLLSLVLTGTISVFSKFVSKTPAYEVLHYSQPHVDYHHVDVPVPAVAYGHPVYAGRELSAQDIAYNAHTQ